MPERCTTTPMNRNMGIADKVQLVAMSPVTAAVNDAALSKPMKVDTPTNDTSISASPMGN